jgi:hypothetical protein
MEKEIETICQQISDWPLAEIEKLQEQIELFIKELKAQPNE